jgi:hypothetical protein
MSPNPVGFDRRLSLSPTPPPNQRGRIEIVTGLIGGWARHRLAADLHRFVFLLGLSDGE